MIQEAQRREGLQQGNNFDKGLVWEFLETTQADALARLTERHGEATRDKVIKRLDTELGKRGLVDVVRHGIEVGGNVGIEKLELGYFKPESTLNPEIQALYEKNIFSVIRQVHFNPRTEQSVDLVLFLNGIPLATVELRTSSRDRM